MQSRPLRRSLIDVLAWVVLVLASALALRAAASLGRIGFVLATGHEPAILGQLLPREGTIAADARR